MMRSSWIYPVFVAWFACGCAADEESLRHRLELWQRGIHEVPGAVCDGGRDGRREECAAALQRGARFARSLPVLRHRGGFQEDNTNIKRVDYTALKSRLGGRFTAALDANAREHREDCAESCELFYCGPGSQSPSAEIPAVRSISMGSVPPEDFASEFRYPLDLIKVSKEPLFSAAEAAAAIETARSEDVDSNEYTSGKYKLGGDWLKKMPKTRLWFNSRLESTIFPAIAASFPEVVTNASTLRAHSVAMLKYNATHPRTDVHIDNGVLALTLALSPSADYVGGGTFFEHLGENELVEMEAGHATWRPGSVRHGGHRVTSGVRYIIGAFLLLEDKVEHVRRLKNRGSDLRTAGDVQGAVEQFQWALEINPTCATCLKDMAEARMASGEQLELAEAELRKALDLLPSDSDALFTLGALLSTRGDDAAALEAYERAAAVNADDVELLYNLGIKLGEAGRGDEERKMYERALKADPKYAKAHTNLGAAYAEMADFDNAELHFTSATKIEPGNLAAWQNLAVLLQQRGMNGIKILQSATSQEGATLAATNADGHFAGAEGAWRAARGLSTDEDIGRRLAAVLQLRGRAAAVTSDIKKAIGHFLEASQLFPGDPQNWAALAKLHELNNDPAQAAKAALNAQILNAVPGA